MRVRLDSIFITVCLAARRFAPGTRFASVEISKIAPLNPGAQHRPVHVGGLQHIMAHSLSKNAIRHLKFAFLVLIYSAFHRQYLISIIHLHQ